MRDNLKLELLKTGIGMAQSLDEAVDVINALGLGAAGATNAAGLPKVVTVPYSQTEGKGKYKVTCAAASTDEAGAGQ